MTALEEYREWARGYEWFSEQAQTAVALADAAIAELEGDVEYWKHHYKDCKASDYRNAMAAQKAEAEHERLRSQVQGWKDRAANYEDYMERLRVCGTCGHHEAGECELGAFGMSGFDYCRYAESSWTPYWEADER